MNPFHSGQRYLAILALALFCTVPAFAQVSISIAIAPPPLIVEDQPPMPDDGLIWTPGYWAYDDDQGEYYWVDGAWVQPPQEGFYWTPAYWAWNDGAYAFNPGYWGPTVGFYGGVNYGYGYWGNGYGGGRWENNHFAYNTAANNVGNVHAYKTYADRSAVRPQSSRVSFNGGRGGLTARPTAEQQQAARATHVQATAQQQTHFQQAGQQRTHQVKVDKTAAKLSTPGAAPGAQPNAQPAVQPAVNKPEHAFTGGDAQRKDQPVDRAPAPSTAMHQDQVKAPEDPRLTGQETAPAKHEAAPSGQPRPEAQSNASMQQHAAPQQAAPEQHHAEGPGPGAASEQHAAAPQNHPAAQAQQHQQKPAPAKAQGQPDAHPQGDQGGGGSGQKQDGH